jgi:hypothetical protein
VIISNISEKVLRMEMDPQSFCKAAFPFLKTGTTTPCFHRLGKIRCDEPRLKINLKVGIKISKQPFITNAGIPSNPPDFDGCRHHRALTSDLETDAIGRADDQKSVQKLHK